MIRGPSFISARQPVPGLLIQCLFELIHGQVPGLYEESSEGNGIKSAAVYLSLLIQTFYD